MCKGMNIFCRNEYHKIIDRIASLNKCAAVYLLLCEFRFLYNDYFSIISKQYDIRLKGLTELDIDINLHNY